MKPRIAACIVALMLLVPTALAAPGLVSSSLLLAGTTSVQGDAAALFFLSHANGFTWEVTADSATLEREFSTYTAVQHPLSEENYLHAFDSEWQTESTDLGTLALASLATNDGGAMLVRSAWTSVRADSEGLVRIAAQTDPTVAQDEPADAEAPGADRGVIEAVIPGEYLNITFSEGTFTLAGELTLVMYGPSYQILGQGAEGAMRTGEFETARTALYVEGRQERHTLTLQNAILHVRASEPVTLFTAFPTIDVDGTLQAPGAEGAITLGGRELAAPLDGEPLTYHGAAQLSLTPSSGLVATSARDLSLAASLVAPRGPTPLVLGAAASLTLLVLAAAAAFLWRRRLRPDDLELALLAMEERRWEDALPRLTRVVRAHPDHAHALIDRALCFEQTGRFREAAHAFEAALRTTPGQAEAHFYYARTLAKMKERDAARVHLEEALERDPRLVEMARAELALRGL